jgi:hypothetical protein
MERHHSTGVTTIVALMAAHRTACGRDGMSAAYDREEVARIEDHLREDKQAAPPRCQRTRRNLSRACYGLGVV